MAEEVDLRRLWICLVYLTLEAAGTVSAADEESVGQTVPADLRQKFGTFVTNVVAAKKRGATLKTLKLDELFSSPTAAESRTPLETAILSQSMRVCFLTMVVIDEERLASGEDDTYYPGKDDEPGPFIPGSKS